MFFRTPNWERAIEELKALVEKDPSDVRTRLKLGDVYATAGRLSEALEVYAAAAESYVQSGFFLKAIAVLKQILKHAPGSAQHRRRLAELYRHVGLLEEAEALEPSARN